MSAPTQHPHVDVDALKRSADPVDIIGRYVELRKEGHEWVGSCPFHQERTPSFKVSDRGFVCFGCGAKGDVLRFIQDFNGVGFAEAARTLNDLIGGLKVNIPTSAATQRPPSQHAEEREPTTRKPDLGKHVASYTYVDEQSRPLFQVRRFERIDAEGQKHKSFLQYRPNGAGWLAGINDPKTRQPTVRLVLYRLDQLQKATEVYVVEGERDVHTLESAGLVATTNRGGAKQPWLPEYSETLRGKHVVIFPDNDAPGLQRGETIRLALQDVARSVIVVPMPNGFKDVTEFIEAGGTADDLAELVREARSKVEIYPIRYDWRDLLITSANGNIKASIANVITALRHAPEWNGLLAYNEFNLTAFAQRTPPWPNAKPGDWRDQQDRLVTDWMHREGIFVSVDIAAQAVQTVAQDRSIHPVRSYLRRLRWDACPRIDTWLTTYLGVADSAYTRAVGQRWLISAVARIFEPGCKVDTCLILEGAQGIRKSTALKILSEPWFTDEIADLGSKDAAMQAAGVWIIEISELDSMNRADVGRVKAFLSRTNDRFRPPYGRHVIDVPRQCVFAGTTNKRQYLFDETGNRRFWFAPCGAIDPDALRRDRDQLWAEAVASYHSKYVWWLDTDELNAAAEEAQEERYDGDPWDRLVETWLQNPSQRWAEERSGSPAQPIEPFTSTSDSVTICDILTHCIGKDQAHWTQADKNRIARLLTANKWSRRRVGCRSNREWRYIRVSV